MESIKVRLSITKDWLPRYTGMEIPGQKNHAGENPDVVFPIQCIEE